MQRWNQRVGAVFASLPPTRRLGYREVVNGSIDGLRDNSQPGLLRPDDRRGLSTDQRYCIEAALIRARNRWPQIDLPTDTFATFVFERLPRWSPQQLAALHTDDLYLVCGFLQGSAVARRYLEDHCLRAAQGVLIRAGAQVHHAEFRRRLREALLLSAWVEGEDGAFQASPPRVARYAGRGKLKNWLRATAEQLLMDMLREGRGAATDAAIAQPHAPSRDALRESKDPFRRDFQVALQAAFEQLTAREQELLQQRYVEGRATEQIAAIGKRHQVSIAAELTYARERLLMAVRGDLATRLRVQQSEVDALLCSLKSRLHVSLEHLLIPPGFRRRN